MVQEVFMKLFAETLADDDQVATWIYRTSTNRCIDRMRALKRRDPEWQKEVARTITTHDWATQSADRDLVRRVIAELPEKLSIVATLVHFDEMTQEEAARVLDVSRKTVNERLAEFTARAQKLIEKWRA